LLLPTRVEDARRPDLQISDISGKLSDMPKGALGDTSALFVRLPAEQARRLDQAANALSARKKDLVTGLIERYLHPDTPEGLEELRRLSGSASAPRRVTIDLQEPAIAVGHHSFQPAPVTDVLTAAQAAELLAVEEQAIINLAEQQQLPGRKISGQWRFARQALLDWLSEAPGSND
jgi:excisionase family DNA binding protein